MLFLVDVVKLSPGRGYRRSLVKIPVKFKANPPNVHVAVSNVFAHPNHHLLKHGCIQSLAYFCKKYPCGQATTFTHRSRCRNSNLDFFYSPAQEKKVAFGIRDYRDSDWPITSTSIFGIKPFYFY